MGRAAPGAHGAMGNSDLEFVVWRGSACWSLESSYGRRQELRPPDLRGDFRSHQAFGGYS